ncbi:38089_t:CDS:1, partial [Gigaspora margarita]
EAPIPEDNLNCYYKKNVKMCLQKLLTPNHRPKNARKVTVTNQFEENNKIFFCNVSHATQTGKGLLFYYKNEILKEKQMPPGIINLIGVVCRDIGQNKFKIIIKNDKEYESEAPNEEFKETLGTYH